MVFFYLVALGLSGQVLLLFFFLPILTNEQSNQNKSLQDHLEDLRPIEMILTTTADKGGNHCI